MSDAGPVLGILFAHGVMAAGMVDAVRRITGCPEDTLLPLSNDSGTPEALLAEIEAMAGDREVVIFTDLLGGSCATAARLGTRDHPRRAVVCGVNLPMLLEFVFHREEPLPELVDRVTEKGQQGVCVVHRPT